MDYCNPQSYNEQQKLTDLLSSEKYLASVYNSACCESATPVVKSCLCALLQDEHRIGDRIFGEMSSRGWYPVEKAEDTKLNAARQKFEANVTV